MLETFYKLEFRERALVIGAGVFILLALIYSQVWSPLTQSTEQLKISIATQQQNLQWMQQAAEQARQLKAQNRYKPGNRRGSLLTLVDQTAKRNKLGQHLKKVEPSAGAVRVSLEQASFDAMVDWLQTLQAQHDITVKTISVERNEAKGRVNARITLAGS